MAIAMLTQFLLDLIVGTKLCFQDSLSLLLDLDLFMDRGNLVAALANLLSLIARVQNHVLVEALFKAFLLGEQLLSLLLVFGQAVIKSVNLWLILHSDALNCRVNVSLYIAIHGCGT